MAIRKDLIILLLVFLIVGLLPLFFHDNLHIMNILTMCLIWGVVAAAWDLIMGFAGIFTFGQIAFFVMGAYGSAILTRTYGISPWLGLLAGGGIAGLLGVLVGLPCLRLKGAYVALVTFAVHMILEPLLKSDLGRSVGTGGTQGLLSIPSLKLGSYHFSHLELVPWFYTAFGIALISLLIIYKIIHSPWGLAFVALRDSETFAKSLGVDDFKYKLMVYGMSAVLTGVIGGFYGHYVGVLSTRILGLDLFLLLMVILVVGGIGQFPGAVIGSFITVFFSEMLRPLETYRLVIFGGVVVLLVLFLPGGMAGVLVSARATGPMKAVGRFAWKKSERRSSP
jgi:branched-chain amino acid transport system permease protein